MLLGISLAPFALAHLAPGDPISVQFGLDPPRLPLFPQAPRQSATGGTLETTTRLPNYPTNG
jgi:hypothetical protein